MSSTEHKQVYVIWPGGFKTGPHTQTFDNLVGYVDVLVNGYDITIPKKWTEGAKPDIEEGRLVYVWDNPKPGGVQPKKGDVAIKYNSEEDWDNFEPVFRRWDELKESEKTKWLIICGQDNTYKLAYEMITGEEHP